MSKGKLGKLIKQGREEKNWDQKKLAIKLAKTTSTISQIESGQLIPGEKLLMALCKLLSLDFHKAWLIAQTEKARTAIAKQISMANLREYEASKKANNTNPTENNIFSSYNNFEQKYALIENSNFKISQTTASESESETNTYFAFKRDWLERLGGEKDKTLFKVKSNSMSPLIEDGDIIMVDQSARGKKLESGQVYIVKDKQGPVVKRVYPGQNPNYFILSSENNKDYPDRELHVRKSDSWPIIGKVMWLSRELIDE